MIASPGSRLAVANSAADTPRTVKVFLGATFPLAGNGLAELRVIDHQQHQRFRTYRRWRFYRRRSAGSGTAGEEWAVMANNPMMSKFPASGEEIHGRCYAIGVSSVRRRRWR